MIVDREGRTQVRGGGELEDDANKTKRKCAMNKKLD